MAKQEKFAISKTKIARRASKKTDLVLKRLIIEIKKSDSKFWLQVAKLLARPKRRVSGVNIKKINEIAKENETVLVPGKVLGAGILEKPITLACYKISNNARQMLNKSKSKLISISELYKKNKDGEGIKLIA